MLSTHLRSRHRYRSTSSTSGWCLSVIVFFQLFRFRNIGHVMWDCTQGRVLSMLRLVGPIRRHRGAVIRIVIVIQIGAIMMTVPFSWGRLVVIAGSLGFMRLSLHG